MFEFSTATSFVKLAVFDVLGNEVEVVVDTRMPAGRPTVTFDAHRLASGVCFYRLMVNGTTITKKALLFR